MAETTGQITPRWVLFMYTGANQFLHISKAFKTREEAEKD